MDQGPKEVFRPPLAVLAAVAVAIVAVGLFKVPLGTVLLLGLLLLCPLMMAGMHGGGHSHGQSGGSHDDHTGAATDREDATAARPHRH